ncbi:apolipoprotein N-acyltransferase [Rubrivivax gelatinosus]|uniref:Apolipoprotein N-acyltransferase n=1 Tax=Rubrivivax gelatinosus (strain NBRC 100245 / IL144) TaxID=983917 RepID=I0HXG7_RUBGI|nr:apolipoprotein N-acyltransferase [Rubrivivax gelatinosus]BAL97704.1 apolipoprotein N-acyltransferase Lnt [Rubrivivax gelatinosus IL144]
MTRIMFTTARPAARGRWSLPLVMAALGALQTLAFVQTTAWPLAVVSTALLALACGRAAPGRAALLGWAYGFGWLAAGTWWLYVSMHRYGGLPAPLAAAGVAALAAALSLYLAAAMAAFARWRRGRAAPDAALFAALWLLAELARGVLFTGFPWVASGYALVDAPLAALAPWVGVYGLGAVLAFAAALLAHAATLRRGRVAPLLAALALLGLPGLAALQRFDAPAGALTVTLVQTNVAQDEKFAVERMPEAMAWLEQALDGARGQLVVAPETAVPLLPFQLAEFAPGYWDRLVARFAAPGRAALVGVPLGDFDRGYTNSVAGLSDGERYRYDKHHLVPFGEFVPTGFRWFTEAMNIPLGDFDRGVVNPPSFAALGQRIGPNICYEDLFGEELARRFADPAAAPTIFANVSNIAWFGDTVALPQHLNISRLRALEFQRPMIRATNTGMTVVIDAHAEVTAELAPGTRGVLETEVEGRTGVTPFAWWAARFGLWPLALLAALVVMLSAGWRRRAA